jgi:polyisoprenoid-binding protein YceI
MSSFKASAINPRMAGVLTRSLYAAGFSLAISALSTQAYAGCQYVVANQWNNGFTATIKITNSGTSAINGWNINWQYSGDNRVTSSYNATLSGTNPYSATNLGWNGSIAPNQTVEFGFQGSKGAGSAEIPVINGAACGDTAASSASVASSIASSVATSKAASSTPASSSRASNSSTAAVAGTWSLDSSASYLNFATTKNTHNVEVHNFTSINGDISAAGVATLTIDLSTVNTGVALRDERMRGLLFDVTNFPTATVTVAVPATLISSLAVGQSAATSISASLNLHGVTGAITTKVSVQKLSANRVLVQSLSPILVKAGDYALTDGVEALRAAVGIASISVAVPVDFALVFDAR